MRVFTRWWEGATGEEKGLRAVIGLRFLRRWKGMEPGGRKRLRRKENLVCEADEKETRVDTDTDELADKKPEVEEWEDATALGEPGGVSIF